MSATYKSDQLWFYEKKLNAARLARQILQAGDYVIWDSETTDLNGYFVSLAAIDTNSRVLIDTLINPQDLINPKAQAVHGITNVMLVGQPTFIELYDQIKATLGNRHWAIYNQDFDCKILSYECQRAFDLIGWQNWKMITDGNDSYCVMHLYAQFWGAYSDYHGSFTWQKLVSACERFNIEIDAPPHSALGDCLRTLAVLQKMSEWLNQQEKWQ